MTRAELLERLPSICPDLSVVFCLVCVDALLAEFEQYVYQRGHERGQLDAFREMGVVRARKP